MEDSFHETPHALLARTRRQSHFAESIALKHGRLSCADTLSLRKLLYPQKQWPGNETLNREDEIALRIEVLTALKRPLLTPESWDKLLDFFEDEPAEKLAKAS